KTHSKIRALEAPFSQLKKVSLSRKPRKSGGILYIRKEPGKASMKVLFVVKTEPFRSKVLFTDEEVVFHDIESGEITRRDPRQGGVKPSEIWVMGRPVSEIVKHYTPRVVPLEGEGEEGGEKGEAEKYMAKLELVPKSKKVRKWVRCVLVWLRKKDALGTRVRIVDRSGDYQEFSFDEKKLEINPELEDDLFEIE
ncbi:MAG: LolA family protein, partial [Planctomycetota bacterium]